VTKSGRCVRSLALVFLALAMSGAAFASQVYKSEIISPPPANNSLQGWNGNISACIDDNAPACWKHRSFIPYHETKTWSPVAILGAGVVLPTTIGHSQSFPIGNPATDEFFIYNAQPPSQTGALFEVFLGSEWYFRPRWALQMGVDFEQVYTNYNADGTLIQGADVASEDQFTYRYNATIRQILAEVKLLYQYRERLHPYLLAGVGAALNTAYNYNTSVPPFYTFTRQFSNNTCTSFTYALGLGLDLDITHGVRLGLGYRFSDLGKVALGPASINNIPVSGTLSQTHTYSNILLTQLTFVFL